ncbi:hypothetical protein BDY19DRAFT_626841 [Irpex rosettiformis]|uniref:Uncharacterized protein n=1 Tax=Irpex rosettiformis TaxID=378272 RepID=A0ACB8UAV4_9APHY|nr:hypothetical protein BDY19DRAFT_626841 [Irpex rosettiformis]
MRSNWDRLAPNSVSSTVVTEQALQNLIDIVDNPTEIFNSSLEHPGPPAAIPPPLTAIHALKIVSLAIHLVRAPNASQLTDMWHILCNSLTRLLYQTMGIVPVPGGEEHTDVASIMVRIIKSYTSARLSHEDATSAISELAEGCLQHMQTRDLRAVFPRRNARREKIRQMAVRFQASRMNGLCSLTTWLRYWGRYIFFPSPWIRMTVP